LFVESGSLTLFFVMAGLVPATHTRSGKSKSDDRHRLNFAKTAFMGGRDKPGHDG
jgi:hypothetical protein